MCPGPLALHHEHDRVLVRFMPGLCVKAHKEDTAAFAMAIDLLMQEVRRRFPLQSSAKSPESRVSGVFMDGTAAGAAAVRALLPDARIHRDLQHVKKDFVTEWPLARQGACALDEQFRDVHRRLAQ
eukprot:11414220-Alexandrium_andersonii.AAC.1